MKLGIKNSLGFTMQTMPYENIKFESEVSLEKDFPEETTEDEAYKELSVKVAEFLLKELNAKSEIYGTKIKNIKKSVLEVSK